jgi:hypothetical protein
MKTSKDELIELLSDMVSQIQCALYGRDVWIKRLSGDLAELCMISKIELGDDVIQEITRLKQEIQKEAQFEFEAIGDDVMGISDEEEIKQFNEKIRKYLDEV